MMWSNIECLYDSSNDCGVCPDVRRCKKENIAGLLREGKSYKEIAVYFGVSVRSIERHLPK